MLLQFSAKKETSDKRKNVNKVNLKHTTYIQQTTILLQDRDIKFRMFLFELVFIYSRIQTHTRYLFSFERKSFHIFPREKSSFSEYREGKFSIRQCFMLYIFNINLCCIYAL